MIHNDFHPGNVLVDPASSAYVVGVLDFGDVLYSARVIDVAVAMGYLVTAAAPAWPAVQPFLDGYLSLVRLTDVELELLPGLVSGRLVQRILIARARDAGPVDRLVATLENLET